MCGVFFVSIIDVSICFVFHQHGTGCTYDFIVTAKEAKSCIVNGETYKDGEEFKMGCKMLCTCQNGQHACSTLCPQEDRRPSRLHCREPRLIEIQGQCCKEWTCPLHYQPGSFTSEESGNVGMLVTIKLCCVTDYYRIKPVLNHAQDC